MSLYNLFNKSTHNIDWDLKEGINQYEINYNQSIIKNDNKPGIIIDNGSYHLKAGFSNFDLPNFSVKQIVGKIKVQTKDQINIPILGESLFKLDPGKLNKKTQFEKNIITQFSLQENMLDYTFNKLGLKDDKIDYNLTITEPICNLSYSRKHLNEIIFELYNVPMLTWGVDSLFSAYYNKLCNNYLLITSGYNTTHIIPVINSLPVTRYIRRINIGGQNQTELLMQTLSLKYPEFKAKFTNELCNFIKENFTECAVDYNKQLELLEKIYLEEQNRVKLEEIKYLYGSLDVYNKVMLDDNINYRKHLKCYPYLKSYSNYVKYHNNLALNEMANNTITEHIQNNLNFINWPLNSTYNGNCLSNEDIKRKQEQRVEQGKRLRELMAKKREEKLKQNIIELEELEKLHELKDIYNESKFLDLLNKKNVSSEYDLINKINKLQSKINNNSTSNINNNANIDLNIIDEEAKWPLINIEDNELNEEQIKSKKIQKLQKTAYLVRLEKKKQLLEEKQKIEDFKKSNPQEYLLSLFKKKKITLDKLESYKQMRKDMQNRRSKININRMMVLAELGKEDSLPNTGIKPRVKGYNNSQSTSLNNTIKNKNKKNAKLLNSKNDNFGENEEDWDIYKEIAKHNLLEDEEDEKNNLEDIENQIAEVNPEYNAHIDIDYNYNSVFSTSMYLGVDQFRGAELIFKPYIIGIDQTGINEIIEIYTKCFNYEEQQKLFGNVLLCGGNMAIKNIENRIYKDIRSKVNCDIDINIKKSEDFVLDAWKGARDFYNNNLDSSNLESCYISKEEYLDSGNSIFKRHMCSNLN